MAYSISIHNGNHSRVSQEHNLRDPRHTSRDGHITPGGSFEVWHHEDLRDAYDRIFGDAVRDFNARQTKHPTRKIASYYDKVRDDKSTNPRQLCYEMIVTIGNKDHCPAGESRAILSDFARQWRERNPSLEIVGLYYHADERGAPHLHIDYVPVSGRVTPYKSGMRIQNGLSRALQEQGIEHSPHTTAQIRWQESERDALQKICEEHGLEIERGFCESDHLETDAFKRAQDAKRELERTTAELSTARQELDDAKAVSKLSALQDDACEALRPTQAEHMEVKHKRGSVIMSEADYGRLQDGYDRMHYTQDLAKKIGPQIEKLHASREYESMAQTRDRLQQEVSTLQAKYDRSREDFVHERAERLRAIRSLQAERAVLPEAVSECVQIIADFEYCYSVMHHRRGEAFYMCGRALTSDEACALYTSVSCAYDLNRDSAAAAFASEQTDIRDSLAQMAFLRDYGCEHAEKADWTLQEADRTLQEAESEAKFLAAHIPEYEYAAKVEPLLADIRRAAPSYQEREAAEAAQEQSRRTRSRSYGMER